MAILVRPNYEASHWYTAAGEPLHEVQTKDGGTRPTNLRDARKLRLLPSVTNILNVLAKPQLENWKMKQVAIAADSLPRAADEPVETWVDRIVSASKEPVVQAADLGSKIHEALELATNGQPYDESLADYVRPVLAWLASNVAEIVHREKVLVNITEGYAGRTDLIIRRPDKARGVIDFKTRRTHPGETVNTYDGQATQLAAYAAAYFGPRVISRCWLANVFISSTEPGRIEAVIHEDPRSEYRHFLHCAAIWRHLKSYDPRQQPARPGEAAA